MNESKPTCGWNEAKPSFPPDDQITESADNTLVRAAVRIAELERERDEARAEVARLRLRLKDSDSIRHAEKEILIQEIAEVARLRKLLGRLQLCASALLGWHSETMNIEAVRKVAEVVCDAEMELKKAPKVTSATTHIMEERE